MGAEVILVEPPGGHESRGFEPFIGDVRNEERSLWFHHYNAGKCGIVLISWPRAISNYSNELYATADIVIEAMDMGLPVDPGKMRVGVSVDVSATDLGICHTIWTIAPSG